MEEERTNGNELKIELKRIRTQIIRLQKKGLGQKDFLRFKIALCSFKKSILNKSFEKNPSSSQTDKRGSLGSLEAQTDAMVSASNPNRNTNLTGTPVVKTGNNKDRVYQLNCRSKGPATGSNLLSVSVTCHACGEKGHYKSQCSKIDNSTFHVSKKNLCDESLIIPKKEIWLDDKLNYVEESVEIMDREVKQLRRRCIPIVKVRWNSEFTWEREDQIHAKYPHLFSNIIVSLN
ncbi:putative reverse transcriptase domain-containing protein [Tanacetum coccineum]|uniref:Reverse transcriptase domain-containing protein n=1 Tax=Tanacetum coccineum TaxID=301880 RepID=A0ABQ5FG01_9ASTR